MGDPRVHFYSCFSAEERREDRTDRTDRTGSTAQPPNVEGGMGRWLTKTIFRPETKKALPKLTKKTEDRRTKQLEPNTPSTLISIPGYHFFCPGKKKSLLFAKREAGLVEG